MSLKLRTVLPMVAISMLLAACAIPKPNIMPLGPDTYRNSIVYSEYAGGYYNAQQLALNSSSQYCVSQGLQYMVVSTDQRGDSANGMLDVDFRCLKTGDTGLMRPTMQRTPDIIIQNQAR